VALPGLQCETVYEEKCETKYDTVQEQQCQTVYDNQCNTVQEQKCETRYEDKCETKGGQSPRSQLGLRASELLVKLIYIYIFLTTFSYCICIYQEELSANSDDVLFPLMIELVAGRT
jgi:hypothetical protein